MTNIFLPMFTKTLQRFKALPATTQAMVFLFWVYEFSQVIVNLFMNLFVFLETKSLFGLVAYNLVFFIAIFFGFVVWGFLMAQWQISFRYNYFRAFAVYTISFLTLIIFPHSFGFLLLFAALNGLGLGMFWVGVHAYEMITTKSGNRDFYSSMVSAGAQALAVISPLLATLSFYLSEQIFHVETFKILFWTLPFVYLLSLPFIFRLPDFIAPRVTKSEINRLWSSKKLRPVHIYNFATAIPWGIRVIMMPTIMLAALKTVINVGLFQALVGILAILAVIILSHKRHEGNRITILFYATLCIIFDFMILLFWQQTPYAYVFYSIILVFVQPIHRVSQHVIDLHSMELLREKKNHFYAGMLFRDCVISVGRIGTILTIGALMYFLDDFWVIQASILLSALAFLWSYLAAKRMIRLN